MGIFDFLNDTGNYESRMIERDDFEWGFISTARVSDGKKPYETAICHKDYGDGKIIIVDAYSSIPESRDGHFRWVEKMKSQPDKLVDCDNSAVQNFLTSLGSPTVKMRNTP